MGARMSDQQLDQSDQEAGASDGIKPWTIKGISWEARNGAIAAAKRERLEIGAWMTRAILRTIKADQQADRAPVPLPPPELPTVRPSDLEADLVRIERLTAVVSQAAMAGQMPLSRRMVALINRQARELLMTSGGPTIVLPRLDLGQTDAPQT
jgi:hypothetical protein